MSFFRIAEKLSTICRVLGHWNEWSGKYSADDDVDDDDDVDECNGKVEED